MALIPFPFECGNLTLQSLFCEEEVKDKGLMDTVQTINNHYNSLLSKGE